MYKFIKIYGYFFQGNELRFTLISFVICLKSYYTTYVVICKSYKYIFNATPCILLEEKTLRYFAWCVKFQYIQCIKLHTFVAACQRVYEGVYLAN